MKDFTHIAFADESNYTGSERFGAYSLITMKRKTGKKFEQELKGILQDNNVNEIKWKKVGKDDKYTKTVFAFFNKTIDFVKSKSVRVDVICWDNNDSRHKIKGRDDIANFHRMIHHLLYNTLTKRWSDNIKWAFFPDKNSSVNWDEVQYFLELKKIQLNDELDLFENNHDNTFKEMYHIHHFKELDSQKFPIIQLADLFAGMLVFSRKEYNNYKQWKEFKDGLQSLFPISNNELNLTNSNKKRFEIISYLRELCRKYSLGVSLDKKEGLNTPDPTNPINFWWYEPQHINDKSPTKLDRK